jgi:hypothetical protein
MNFLLSDFFLLTPAFHAIGVFGFLSSAECFNVSPENKVSIQGLTMTVILHGYA